MRKSLAVFLLLVVFGAAPALKAQDETSKVELYAGYDYMRVNVNARVPGFPAMASFNGEGGSGQLEYNANNWLGIVGDLGGYYFTTAPHGGAFSYLAGPRLNLRRGKITPFAQTLFGGFLSSDGIGRLGPENHFAMTIGGGIDVRVSKHVAIRPVQAEYFMTTLPDGLNNRQNNFRFSAGIVIRLGKA